MFIPYFLTSKWLQALKKMSALIRASVFPICEMEVGRASCRLGGPDLALRHVLAWSTCTRCDVTSNPPGHIQEMGLIKVPMPPRAAVGAGVGASLA